MNRKYTKAHILFDESGSIMSIDLMSGKIDNYRFGRSISTDYKTSDRCEILFEKSDFTTARYLGYVPDCFPGNHYGDYIEFSISKDGKIQEFSIQDDQIDELIASSLPFDFMFCEGNEDDENDEGRDPANGDFE